MAFSWRKRGRVFIPQDVRDRAWLKNFAQAPAVLKFDDFIRVYFSCRPDMDEKGQFVSYSAFLDLDRGDLFKVISISKNPVLSLGNRGTFDEFGTYPFSVIRREEDILGYYAGWTRCESVPFNVSIGAALSRDNGVSFQKVGLGGPQLSFTPDEPFVMSGPKIRFFNGVYYLFYIAGRRWIPNEGRPEPVYKIRMATSEDGLHWTKASRDLIESKLGEDEAQASPDVIFSNGMYHMFFCYRYGLDYRGKEKGYRIGYATSENLLDWKREDHRAGIDVSESGWDSEMISYPHVFELDGKHFMFYLGNGVGKEGFGLAELEGELI